MTYAKNNIEGRKANQKRYYERHKAFIREKKRVAMQKYRETEVGRLASSAATSKFYKANPEIASAASRKRYAKKRLATPQWLSELQKDQISLFQEAADKMKLDTGINFHVDHIIPIQGKYVSGLHVPWNLQVITAQDNHRKGNK